MKTEIIGIVSITVQEADESFVCAIADELYNMPGKKQLSVVLRYMER